MDDRGLQERGARLESLLAEIETLADPNARAKAAEVVQLLLELYGEGLSRVMEVVARGVERERVFGAFADDELVSHLLLLHGLHPLDPHTRVARALEEVRPYLRSHGGDVELLGIESGVARVRMEGSCDGCPSSAATLKLAIEEAIQKAAPDLDRVEAEGVTEPRPTFVAGPTLRRKRRPESDGAPWTVVQPGLSGDGTLVKEVSGEPVLFAKLENDLYAYRHLCPGCGETLEEGNLKESKLICAGCGRGYDVRRAGRCPEDPQVHLDPIPLLVGEGGVKIALPSAVG